MLSGLLSFYHAWKSWGSISDTFLVSSCTEECWFPSLPYFCFRQRGIKTLEYSATVSHCDSSSRCWIAAKMDSEWHSKVCIPRKYCLGPFRVGMQRFFFSHLFVELADCFEIPGPSSWCSTLLSVSLLVQQNWIFEKVIILQFPRTGDSRVLWGKKAHTWFSILFLIYIQLEGISFHLWRKDFISSLFN